LLKKQYFEGEVTEEKIREKQGKRLNDADWNYLKEHWSKPESIVSHLSSTAIFTCCLLVTAIFLR
jgi:hypothetical protein